MNDDPNDLRHTGDTPPCLATNPPSLVSEVPLLGILLQGPFHQ